MSATPEDPFKNVPRNIKISIAIAIGITTTMLISYVTYFHNYPISHKTGEWGSFGDFFGGILNPVVAFMALYWLTKSVQVQRAELNEVKNEMKIASGIQSDQARTQNKQRFEDTFFSLLEQLNKEQEKLLAQTFISPTGGTISFSALRFVIDKNDDICAARLYLHTHNSKIGSYFRVLYHLLQFIAKHHIKKEINNKRELAEQLQRGKPSDEEKFYSNLVRSFLNNDVVALLAYNCATTDNIANYYIYRLLIERYCMLEHGVGLGSSVIDFYKDSSAFGKQTALEVFLV
ncbi:MAG: putative phage abortive infection protein [Halopseudomonas sp.]